MDLAIAYLVELAIAKKLQGKIYTIGLERGDILSLGKFGNMVSKDIQQSALNIQQQIIDRNIIFESCKESGRDPRCVKK